MLACMCTLNELLYCRVQYKYHCGDVFTQQERMCQSNNDILMQHFNSRLLFIIKGLLSLLFH